MKEIIRMCARWLAELFGLVCAHKHTSFAWRGTHGRDYIRCLDCGRCADSKVQF